MNRSPNEIRKFICTFWAKIFWRTALTTCNRYDKKNPTNKIRMFGFTRELLSTAGLDPINGMQHSKFADLIQKKIDKEENLPWRIEEALEGDKTCISSSTWANWWNEVSFPGATYEAVLEFFFPKLLYRWMYRDPSFDRLQCNLSAIDLGWIEASGNPEKAFKEAQQILETIHADWLPARRGKIMLPGPKKRAGVDWSGHRIALFIPNAEHIGTKEKFKLDPRTEIPIGFSKKVRSAISENAKESSSALDLNAPSSILKFMVQYAVESGLPDPGLKQAFILDFMSAALALKTMLWIQTGGQFELGRESSYQFRVINDFIFNDFIFPFQPGKHMNTVDLNDAEEFVFSFDVEPTEDACALFIELRSIYFDCFGFLNQTPREIAIKLDEIAHIRSSLKVGNLIF